MEKEEEEDEAEDGAREAKSGLEMTHSVIAGVRVDSGQLDIAGVERGGEVVENRRRKVVEMAGMLSTSRSDGGR